MILSAARLRVRAALAVAMLASLSAPADIIWGGGNNVSWTTAVNWNFGSGFLQLRPVNNGTANNVMPAVNGLVQTPTVDISYSINSLTFNNDFGSDRFVVVARFYGLNRRSSYAC